MDAAEARAAVQLLMAPGAARNALDCALWDMEARQRGLRLWPLAGCDGAPTARVTAYTISRSEEHTSELQSLMRIPYAVICLTQTRHDTTIAQQSKTHHM